MSAAGTLALLVFLCLTLNDRLTEGCRCLQRHPQEHFCASDVVIRAKVTGKANSTRPAFNIQTVEIFKQLNKNKIAVVYTSQTSCGINLKPGEYLLSGHVEDGVVVVESCDRVERWDSLSSAQKRYLSMYQKGCLCEISPCTGASCLIKMLQRKCLIRVNNSSSLDDEEALQSICLPGSDSFCRWQKILDK
ncbi:metalloproteinase inhibitor 3-like [Puntigrus tetrazona]|uniref:metalloproteinase inhibitor 3-like n=1 Tax=Puntigrus tetrazona TaxID=1606681 RepID=UPI001C8A889E|nr:metalloproteinase inhibitor 3-like [Puntigrus tetrazona]